MASKEGSSVWLRYGSLGLLVAQDTLLVLLLRHSRSRTDAGPYIASCAVATMECCKLLACFTVVLWSCGWDVAKFRVTLKREVLRPREVLKLSVPALLYLVQNNLLYFALSHLRATPYKVVYNLKILTGAVFSRTLLRQELSVRKWLALVALFCGVVVVQTAPHENSAAKTGDDDPTSSSQLTLAQTLGFAAVFSAAVTSGFCGVYQQKILQGSGDSMWARNIQMGVPSVLIGFVSVVLKDGAEVWRDGPFKNFDFVVLGVIFLQALGGLNVAVILKYADNILKGFAAAFSTVASCVLEMALFGFRPSPNFLIGAALINVAAYAYNVKQSKPAHAKVVPDGDASGSSREQQQRLLPSTHMSAPDLSAAVAVNGSASNGHSHVVGTTTTSHQRHPFAATGDPMLLENGGVRAASAASASAVYRPSPSSRVV